MAEALYQRGLISYPRTETDSVDDNFDHRALMERQVPHTQWGAYAQRCVTRARSERPAGMAGSSNVGAVAAGVARVDQVA